MTQGTEVLDEESLYDSNHSVEEAESKKLKNRRGVFGNVRRRFGRLRAGAKKEVREKASTDPGRLEVNEVPDAEAEVGTESASKSLILENNVLNVKKIDYRFLDSADMEYGQVPILQMRAGGEEAQDSDFRTLIYEARNAKCKRLKMQAVVMASAVNAGCQHFFRIQALGTGVNFKFLIVDELGPSLGDVLRSSASFSASTALKLAQQTLAAIEELHTLGFVCRDVKPQAFVLHSTDVAKVYFAHFGLVRQFKYEQLLAAARRRLPFFGSKRYAARIAHMEGERHRGSDLESWCFMVAEFFYPKVLAWRSLHLHAEILRRKVDFFSALGMQTTRQTAPKMPEKMLNIFAYVRSLEYEQAPDYAKIARWLDEMVKEGGWSNTPFEWETNPASIHPMLRASGDLKTGRAGSRELLTKMLKTRPPSKKLALPPEQQNVPERAKTETAAGEPESVNKDASGLEGFHTFKTHLSVVPISNRPPTLSKKTLKSAETVGTPEKETKPEASHKPSATAVSNKVERN